MNILSIGGSDPSTGAGIQSDVKAFQYLDAYPLTVITAITGQNTRKFGQVQPSSTKILKDQLDMIFSDFRIDGIKIGMVYNSEIIKTITKFLQNVSVPIVLDPVIKSTTGGMLIQTNAINDFKKYLIPLSSVITPNRFEAEFLSKSKIRTVESLETVGRIIQNLGVDNIVITGASFQKDKIIDLVMTKNNLDTLESKKLITKNHGSGCNHSAAMVFSLAQGRSLLSSARFAQKFSLELIKGAEKKGKGISITYKKLDKRKFQLEKAIKNFTEIKNISNNIPECQTNFVFSKQSPKSIKDVLGIAGRIVKTGDAVIKAGNLEYGGSKHVATAIIEMNKKFQHICSAINLKYSNELLSKFEKRGFTIKSYNRLKEPQRIKNKEGSSISWGLTEVLKECENPPDIIYHKGDFGKEPMILIFGENPNTVIEKISKTIP